MNPVECATTSCPLECETVQYDLTVSSLINPTINVYRWCIAYNCTSDAQDPSFTFDEFRMRFVRVSVFYSGLEYTQLDVVPAMTLLNLVANIGGSMSLIVGLSFFTVFEMVELFVLMAHSCLSKNVKTKPI